MKREYTWTRTPAKVLTLKKTETEKLGILRIEAVLESLNPSEEGQLIRVNWTYAPSVKTEKIRGNLAPDCFQWAFEKKKKKMEVVVHHSLDDNQRYIYYI